MITSKQLLLVFEVHSSSETYHHINGLVGQVISRRDIEICFIMYEKNEVFAVTKRHNRV